MNTRPSEYIPVRTILGVLLIQNHSKIWSNDLIADYDGAGKSVVWLSPNSELISAPPMPDFDTRQRALYKIFLRAY